MRATQTNRMCTDKMGLPAPAIPAPLVPTPENWILKERKRGADRAETEGNQRKIQNMKSDAKSATKKWLYKGRHDACKRNNDMCD